MMKTSHSTKIFAILIAALLPVGAVFSDVNAVTPSTNDENRSLEWAHVNILDVGPGYIELEFVSTRAFFSCFEIRADGDTGQILEENGGNNYNTDITDGLYPYTCVNNETKTQVFEAEQYVEVRMVFGAETDERFDWTRFDVDPIPYSCVGFKPPANREVTVSSPNRVLPLRMKLVDEDGFDVWEVQPPVVNVSYEPADAEPVNSGDTLQYVGRGGDEGNQFLFNGTFWGFNLSTMSLAPGVYTITTVSGSPGYAIDPPCEVVMRIMSPNSLSQGPRGQNRRPPVRPRRGHLQ
jgi:hypothetical protein